MQDEVHAQHKVIIGASCDIHREEVFIYGLSRSVYLYIMFDAQAYIISRDTLQTWLLSFKLLYFLYAVTCVFPPFLLKNTVIVPLVGSRP